MAGESKESSVLKAAENNINTTKEEDHNLLVAFQSRLKGDVEKMKKEVQDGKLSQTEYEKRLDKIQEIIEKYKNSIKDLNKTYKEKWGEINGETGAELLALASIAIGAGGSIVSKAKDLIRDREAAEEKAIRADLEQHPEKEEIYFFEKGKHGRIAVIDFEKEITSKSGDKWNSTKLGEYLRFLKKRNRMNETYLQAKLGMEGLTHVIEQWGKLWAMKIGQTSTMSEYLRGRGVEDPDGLVDEFQWCIISGVKKTKYFTSWKVWPESSIERVKKLDRSSYEALISKHGLKHLNISQEHFSEAVHKLRKGIENNGADMNAIKEAFLYLRWKNMSEDDVTKVLALMQEVSAEVISGMRTELAWIVQESKIEHTEIGKMHAIEKKEDRINAFKKFDAKAYKNTPEYKKLDASQQKAITRYFEVLAKTFWGEQQQNRIKELNKNEKAKKAIAASTKPEKPAKETEQAITKVFESVGKSVSAKEATQAISDSLPSTSKTNAEEIRSAMDNKDARNSLIRKLSALKDRSKEDEALLRELRKIDSAEKTVAYEYVKAETGLTDRQLALRWITEKSIRPEMTPEEAKSAPEKPLNQAGTPEWERVKVAYLPTRENFNESALRDIPAGSRIMVSGFPGLEVYKDESGEWVFFEGERMSQKEAFGAISNYQYVASLGIKELKGDLPLLLRKISPFSTPLGFDMDIREPFSGKEKLILIQTLEYLAFGEKTTGLLEDRESRFRSAMERKGIETFRFHAKANGTMNVEGRFMESVVHERLSKLFS